MVLYRLRPDDSCRTTAVEGSIALKEALDMHDGFSEGGVFYGRTAVIVTATIALAILLHLI
jgi:hypothetical protein